MHNNTDAVVSCLGHQRPSAVLLKDTGNYIVWHNQTYLRAKRRRVLNQPFVSGVFHPGFSICSSSATVCHKSPQGQRAFDSTLQKFLLLVIISCLCKQGLTYGPVCLARQRTTESRFYSICHCPVKATYVQNVNILWAKKKKPQSAPLWRCIFQIIKQVFRWSIWEVGEFSETLDTSMKVMSIMHYKHIDKTF